MATPNLLEPVSADPVQPTPSEAKKVQGKSPTRIAFERLRKDKIAMVCAAIVLFFLLVAALAGPITTLTHTDADHLNTNLIDVLGMPTIGPSPEHPFGIETTLGRDLFARWCYGAQISLTIAVTATIATTIVGTVLGLIAGFVGGWVDRVISWLVDFFLSLPFLLVAIAAAPIVDSYFPTGDSELQSKMRIVMLVCILTIFGWTGLTRLIRGEVLSLREREFIQAARAIGVPTRRVLFRELLPNLTGPLIVSISLTLPGYVAGEAVLSFLGVGVSEPVPSWGRTIEAARSTYDQYPIYLWLPVLSIALLVLSLNLLGDAVRDAFDPKTRR